jgi:hypothetical protein
MQAQLRQLAERQGARVVQRAPMATLSRQTVRGLLVVRFRSTTSARASRVWAISRL